MSSDCLQISNYPTGDSLDATSRGNVMTKLSRRLLRMIPAKGNCDPTEQEHVPFDQPYDPRQQQPQEYYTSQQQPDNASQTVHWPDDRYYHRYDGRGRSDMNGQGTENTLVLDANIWDAVNDFYFVFTPSCPGESVERRIYQLENETASHEQGKPPLYQVSSLLNSIQDECGGPRGRIIYLCEGTKCSWIVENQPFPYLPTSSKMGDMFRYSKESGPVTTLQSTYLGSFKYLEPAVPNL
ncbi:hypothetical protein QBC35DRAFT_471052 [Podospora australis]|uniref:Uncharacterized protein n=1 Tax=Podospora australis TaxID=1536484 RepID=A0AAN7AM94_9PEZI|nr:hypothetical protein QBC35DRAFT_471052 [Podospora australis]